MSVRTISERVPGEPSGSRNMRASGGSAGTQLGFAMETISVQSA